MDGFNIDLEPYLENLDLSECSTPFWWGTSVQDLTKILDELDGPPPAIQSTPTKPGYQEPAGASNKRFASPLSEIQVSALSKPFVPAATQKNTRWCIKVFNDWAASRNMHLTRTQRRYPLAFWIGPIVSAMLQCLTSGSLCLFSRVPGRTTGSLTLQTLSMLFCVGCTAT